MYESPDGGVTVYRRKFGNYEDDLIGTGRELVDNSNQLELF